MKHHILTALIASAFTLSACGQKAAEKPADTAAPASAEQKPMHKHRKAICR